MIRRWFVAAVAVGVVGCSEYDLQKYIDSDLDEVPDIYDCGPEDETVFPGNPEICDGKDNDCNGVTDDGFDSDLDGIADCFDIEECDGKDNDGDGLIDEDFGDSDSDGIVDCLDLETCDGLDNDGDGLIDEDMDSDSDGIADCFDSEECDGVDNDGDGLIDEGFDTDGDGTPDCYDDEECDGVDNDGDGLIDEDFPDTDLDGVADCLDIEECDGLDNDGDGLIDEGFPDFDGDGIADCVDAEDCDGIDNDGDGLIDEGFPDTDADGIADCMDSEECDGVDNDGDGAVDEGFDVDSDGVADCFDVEECDGLDNDGDGLIDEGFDIDNDGIADCYDYEDCDGIDNDGDGDIDEGFSDTDGDGVADCVDFEECDGVDNDGDGFIDEGFLDTDGDGVADCADTEDCDGVDNNGDGVIDEGYPDTDLDGIADCVDVEECDGVDNNGDGDIDEGFPDLDGDGVADCVDAEDCDGIDNDGDGLIDEGYADTDLDGIADCVDIEECDGIDNDGDGDIDEGFLDTDGDGLVDCLDKEECDGLDNDGDGLIDEGFQDTDLDGIADCMDIEECDGLDNDGNGLIDEGFDLDGDGVADCFDVEICDGLDNDGNGLIDEGFDLDGDGVARCCVKGDFFTTFEVGRGGLEAHMSNQDNTFGLPETIAEGSPSMVGQGRFDHAYQQDQVLWKEAGNWKSTVCLDGEWQTSDLGLVDFSRSAFGDVDNDGCVDMISYEYQAGYYGSHGDSGDGLTALGNCDGTFTTQTTTTWDVLFLNGYWSAGGTYNLADWNGDTYLDMVLWGVTSGGSLKSSAWLLPGKGDGNFDAVIALPDISEAGGFGDFGDFDGDGCADWLVGANDDGIGGAVQLLYGDCFGAVASEVQLLTACTGCYGDGHARFVDFDLDDDLDVMVSWNETMNGIVNLDIWVNDGSGNLTQTPVHQGMDTLNFLTRFREWPANPACPGKGMTWDLRDHEATYSADKVGCVSGDCDPYLGDTSCRSIRSVLCFFEDGSPNPGITMGSYESWAEGDIALSTPTSGCNLTSSAAADAICESEYGTGWRMAEWHDGSSGWNWWAYGDLQTTDRFWVSINNQPANCWSGKDDDNDGYTDVDGDCDDTDPTVYPGAMELCDGQRNDCDNVSWANDDDLVTYFADAGPITDLTVEFALGVLGAAETHVIVDDGLLNVCAGTYYTNVEIDADEVEIVGIDGSSKTVLSGGMSERVIGVVRNNADVEVQGITLTEGYECLGSAISTYDITDCYNGYISVKGVSLTLRDVDIVDNESFFQYSTTGITSGSGGAIRLLSGRLLMEATSIHDNTGSGIWAEHSDITCLGEVANRGGSWGNSWYGFYGFTAMSSTVLNKNFFASYGCDFGTGADDNARADIHVWRLVNYGAILPVNPSFGDGLNTQFSFSVDPFVMSYPTKIYVDVTHVSSGVSEIEKFSDNLTGFLTGGLGGSGTIDYATGQIAVDLALVPDVMTPVQLKYLRIDNNYDYKDDESFYCDQGSGDCY